MWVVHFKFRRFSAASERGERGQELKNLSRMFYNLQRSPGNLLRFLLQVSVVLVKRKQETNRSFCSLYARRVFESYFLLPVSLCR